MITNQDKITKHINALKESISMCRWRGLDDSKHQKRLTTANAVKDYIGKLVRASEFCELPITIQETVETVDWKHDIKASVNKESGKVHLHHWCNSWDEQIEGNERIFLIGLKA